MDEFEDMTETLAVPKVGQGINDFLFNEDLPIEAKREVVKLISLNRRARKDIVVFAEEVLGMQLNEFQKEFLTRTTTPRSVLMQAKLYVGDVLGMLFGKNIAFPSNQVGKTVMIAIKHLYFNYFKIGMNLPASIFDKTYYATLNISPHSRQVRQCSRYAMEILAGEFVIEGDGPTRVNKISPLIEGFLLSFNSTLGEMRFSNGSIFYSVPIGQDQAASLAGGQFAYISYDECAQSHHLEQELGAKIMSRLIKYGMCLDLISTAEVDSPSHQQYNHIVKLGLAHKDGWWGMGGNLDQNKFISEDQRTKIKADLLATDKKKYRQVVLGEFITGGKRFFDQAEIDQLWKLSGPKAMIPGHKYLLISDWGMSDTGDPSEFAVMDYTEYVNRGRIEVVAWESTQGGSPFMQFALLRTLFDAYTEYAEDGMTVISFPKFLMDAAALGGVTIKKMLTQLRPIGFSIEKDEALFILKTEVSKGRDFIEGIEGEIIEKNAEFGSVKSYFIQGLADQMGMYHIQDEKLKQDKVMVLMMGVSYIVKKNPRGQPLESANISRMRTWSRSVRPLHTVRTIRTKQ